MLVENTSGTRRAVVLSDRGSEFAVHGLEIGVQGLRLRVQGSESRIQGPGSRVQGFPESKRFDSQYSKVATHLQVNKTFWHRLRALGTTHTFWEGP